MTRRVGPADLPPGPRPFVRRRCVLVLPRSLGLVTSSTSSEHASTRTTRPHVGQRSRSGEDPSCSSPLQYIEGFRRRRAPEVCRQKPPAVLAGGVFELGRMGGFIATALRLPRPDLQ
ncbi:hypothetical protein T07_575 [Trichinella nelsoni]|uniref:Uncharacterized protein n=1 Tax=Trichinella nelsoni TaxID=6336 RepID=A0A0V0S864_9BILA|nr:hypothetical protein T07_575 [Trichinella nelsoni]